MKIRNPGHAGILAYANNKNMPRGFTLVELIVAITILSILGVIGFLSFSGYSGMARDGVRLTDMSNIHTQMRLYLTKSGSFPRPDNYFTIQMSGSTVSYQWYAGDSVLRAIQFTKNVKDPKDLQYYTYSIDPKQGQAQLMGYFEDRTSAVLFPEAFAAGRDYSERRVRLIGDKVCVLTDSGALSPVQETNTGIVDIGTTTVPYTLYCDNDIVASGTGIVISTAFIKNSIAYKTGASVSTPVIAPLPLIPALAFLVKGERNELSSTGNNAIVTPTLAPSGMTGKLNIVGTGLIGFTPAEFGDGVFFGRGGQQNDNTAYYEFKGASIGALFNNNTEIAFTIKSAYSFAQRTTIPSYNYRTAFSVLDGNGSVMKFTSEASGTRLIFYFTLGGHEVYYYIPEGQEETLFGKDKLLHVRLVTNGSNHYLYFNNVQAGNWIYTDNVTNWNSNSALLIGSASSWYFSSDDAIDEFSISIGAPK